MLQIVSFSGGIGSFCVLRRVVKMFPSEQIKVVFMDTLWEDEDLYRFNDDVFAYLAQHYPGIEVIPLCDGRTPPEVSREQHIVLNNRFPICSQQLKSRLFRTWLKNCNISPDDAVIHIGIDNSETRRCPAITANYKHPVRYLLAEEGITQKDTLLSECVEWGIEIPRLYNLGFDHNNCGGRCFRAGKNHFERLLTCMPDRFAEIKQYEKELSEYARQYHGTNRVYSILKRSRKVNGEKMSIPFTLEELEQEYLTKEKTALSVGADKSGGTMT